MSTYVDVVISPATTTRPVVISVSQATRPPGSSARTASRTESEIWSAILSGWPSVTDSDEKEKERAGIAAGYRLDSLVDLEEQRVAGLRAAAGAVRRQGAERAEVAEAGRGHERAKKRQRVLQVRVDEARGLLRHARGLRRLLG